MTILQTLLKYVTKDEANEMISLIERSTGVPANSIKRRKYEPSVIKLNRSTLRLHSEDPLTGVTLEVIPAKNKTKKPQKPTTIPRRPAFRLNAR